MPQQGYDPIGTVQQAIAALLQAHEPQFLGIGLRMYMAFATVMLVWYGIRVMLAPRQAEDHLFGFAKLLLVLSFGYAMIAFYEVPIPGIGSSFSNLITDQAAFLAQILSAQSVQNAQESLNTLWNALEQPDPWSILANLLYWGMLLIIGLAQFALLFVVSFGMIASAVCALLGPLFIPFFIVPSLEWLFWNWLKSFIQYSFMPVVANAFVLVFERFLSGYLQTLPPGLRLEEQLLFGVHAVMILVTFTVGVLLVPSLTSSIFSGRSGESVLPGRAIGW
jgi:type IV secretory pathway VirB6-like protein